MDSHGTSCENRSSAMVDQEQKTNLLLYCMNTIRKRTVDEQLGDFAEIMKTTVQLKIVYENSKLEVSYDVGSLHASINGSEEYTCVRLCKQDILHKLKKYSNYGNSHFVQKNETANPMRDIYSEGSARNLNNKKNINDLGELGKFVDRAKSPLILKISYFQKELEASYELESCSASARGSTESTCIQQCKIQLLEKLKEFENNARQSANHATSRQPSTTTFSDLGKPETCAEKYIARVSELMGNLDRIRFAESTDTFLDILVEVNTAYYLGLVTDFVVQKAIYEPDRSPVYAKLCSDAYKKATNRGPDGGTGIAETFKYELTESCNNVLRESSLLPRNRTARRPDTRGAPASAETDQHFDVEGRVRTFGTCRFMGELFMQGGFRMANLIRRTVKTFTRAHDAHSLECLCVLLTIIGAVFEKINSATVYPQCSVDKVYELLKSYADSRSTDNGRTLLPWRTTSMINQILRLRSAFWKDGQPDLPRNVFPVHPSQFDAYEWQDWVPGRRPGQHNNLLERFRIAGRAHLAATISAAESSMTTNAAAGSHRQ